MRKNERGFGVVEILLVIVVIGLIGFAGRIFFDRQKDGNTSDNKATDTSTQQSANEQKPDGQTEEPYTAEIPKDWIKKSDTATGAQFAVPSGWADELKVEKFAVDENIHVGFGAPVWVRFASNAQAWQTIDTDANNNPTIVRSENIVSEINIKVENKYTVGTYETGDGGGAQYRVLVVKDSQVFQFSLPSTCDGVICKGDKKWTMEEIKTSIPQFIRTITLK